MRDLWSLKVSQKISIKEAKEKLPLNQNQIEGDFRLFRAI